MDNEAQIKRIWDTIAAAEEGREKLRKESEATFARINKSLEAIDKRLEDVSKKHGGLSNNLGEQLEIDFVEAVRAKGQIGDAKLHSVLHQLRNIHEYDLVALNDKAVFVGEIKQKFLPQDVEQFVEERLPHFVNEFPPHAKGREVYGMIGGGNIVADAKKVAKQHGLILLKLENRALQTENTENARAF